MAARCRACHEWYTPDPNIQGCPFCHEDRSAQPDWELTEKDKALLHALRIKPEDTPDDDDGA